MGVPSGGLVGIGVGDMNGVGVFVGGGVSLNMLVLIWVGIGLALSLGALVCRELSSKALLTVSDCKSGGVGVTISGAG
jgi:hypothetical protein